MSWSARSEGVRERDGRSVEGEGGWLKVGRLNIKGAKCEMSSPHRTDGNAVQHVFCMSCNGRSQRDCGARI